MAHDVVMPQMGESIAEGTITTWLKKVGDKVARDEPLFEIATDKVDAEIPSPVAGVLKEIKVEPGATVPINSVVAVIANEGEGAAAAPAAAGANKPAPAPAASAASKPSAPAPAPAPAQAAPAAAQGHNTHSGEANKSSPLVRKIAAENNVDLRQVPGTGQGGRITKEDIEGFIGGAPAAAASGGAAPAPQTAVAPPPGPSPARLGTTATEAVVPTQIPENYRARAFEGDRLEDLGNMRSKIAEHMVLSKRISPHVGTVWELDFSHVAKLRQKFKKTWEERYGVNLTYTVFLLKAAVDALKAFPIVNASLAERQVIYHNSINLGVAVALDGGLIVPVIHRADELNTLGLARRAADLAARARTKKLKPDEVQAGTFTITNPGSYGPMFNLPIINQPQAAIMGVGTVEKRPVVIDDMIAIRTRAYLSLSFDHRLIDGAVADQFMARVKAVVEGFDEDELAVG